MNRADFVKRMTRIARLLQHPGALEGLSREEVDELRAEWEKLRLLMDDRLHETGEHRDA